MANKQSWAVNGAHDCMQALAEHPLWVERDAWRASGGKDGHGLRGTGLAIGGWVPNNPPTSATGRLGSGGTPARRTRAGGIAGTHIGPGLVSAQGARGG